MSLHAEYIKVQHRQVVYRSTIIFVMYALGAKTNAMAADFQVFTDQHQSIEVPANVRVVELDAPARIESELASDLPTDPVQAAAIVQQRLTDGGTELQRRLTDAYRGVTDAWSLGVSKIPAVVVDRRYVVYGEPDVSRALARIEEYRRTEP